VSARLKALVVETLDIADRQTLPEGRLSPRARGVVVYGVGALVLIAMAYGVLSVEAQTGMAQALIDLGAALDPGLGELLARHRGLLRVAMWTLGALTFYFAVPALVIRLVLGHRLTDYGLNARGFSRHLPIYLALYLPVAVLVLLVAGAPDFQAKYPLFREPTGLGDLLAWEILYALQFFALEFFFRGFLVHGVKDRLGALAVFPMVMPYVMIHFSKPLYEALGAIVAGSVLGLISLRTGSIAGGVFIHVGIAWTMDAAALLHR
jgi:membrane protease YdiL (CAAX protease family)